MKWIDRQPFESPLAMNGENGSDPKLFHTVYKFGNYPTKYILKRFDFVKFR